MTPQPAPTVSVVLPALNEEHTVAGVVASVMPHLHSGLVDEVVVVDSDSTDNTAAHARAAGATVVNWREVTGLGEPQPGKGEALWRGLAATTGDIVVFLDTDLRDPDPEWVPRLIAPLQQSWSQDAPVRLVKGRYRRDLPGDTGGGRVTELTARPVLSAFRPQLADLVQPLSGEYAARRDVLEQLPFAAGYGVEIGLVIDIADRYGRCAIAEVDLGARRHRNRPLRDLTAMAHQVMVTALRRCGVDRSAEIERTLAPDRPPLRTINADQE
ncbi:glucosyl-3-phosphoglycerate synthase [Corynebacterium sp. TAE3-ERU12]|uniref:glucosyl-3-phosphoglycerate synthase n=1 Tax=Corynebacterium sp. TAE3-ERU12 TaxID=2849491 RepID=UPI001C487D43|nr:glucosyl-3-phosphoglycerate synthase [Corynebacterium sp. TAE3-ERU12]MBV7295055.1 glucosyl-3-phosphoglycerate synthase [Corynebacterium sp. TAE3-ERU12]